MAFAREHCEAGLTSLVASTNTRSVCFDKINHRAWHCFTRSNLLLERSKSSAKLILVGFGSLPLRPVELLLCLQQHGRPIQLLLPSHGAAVFKSGERV